MRCRSRPTPGSQLGIQPVASEVVSNSQLRCFKRCKRKYWLAYVQCLKPRTFPLTGARQLGTRVHEALDAYYPVGSQVSDEEAMRLSLTKELIAAGGFAAAMGRLEILKAEEIVKAGDNSSTVSEVLKQHDLAVAMIEGYDQWVHEEGVDSDLEVVAKEQALRTPSPVEGVELIGKLDQTSRRISTGDVGFIDYKTVGDLQTPLKYLGMDEQFRMYALMQRLISNNPVKFQIYRMLKKSKRTDRAKPPFFRDYEVYINDDELRAFWSRLHGEITELLRFERMIAEHPEQHRSIAYPTPTTDCSWDCDFYSVCPLFDDDRSDPEHVLAMNYEVADPHDHYRGQLDQRGEE